MTKQQAPTLDAILGLQLTVAWAGERAAEPERLGWWETDLVDEMAGGDLFARLVPRTAAWAGLELAREAARRVDAAARQKLATPDGWVSLFHFGFQLDEALDDRLAQHKREGTAPEEVLAAAWGVRQSWDPAALEAFLRGDHGKAKLTSDEPAGRKLKKVPSEPEAAARALAASLVPLADAYPLPFGAMPKEWG